MSICRKFLETLKAATVERQVKAVLKEYMPEELKKFRELAKKLTEKMRPAVYELGFLQK